MLNDIFPTIAVCLLLYSFYFAPIIGNILVIYLVFYTSLWPFVLLYLLWIYLDRKTCERDGRRLSFLRSTSLWHIYRKYFPQTLIKTADLPPDHNYLLCFVPHGILATAALSHFASDNSKATEYFPGCTFYGLTLNSNFYVPFFREMSLGFGLLSVSRKSMLNQLNSGQGKILSMYPGGAAEAYLTRKGHYRTLIKKRKGFIKIALLSGASLVPAFGFGETDLFEHWLPPPGSFWKKFQNGFQYLTGAIPCYAYAQGFTSNMPGILPYRKPVTTVIGKPIHVKKNLNPTNEDIDKLHQEFVDSVKELFNEHKHIVNPNIELEFVE